MAHPQVEKLLEDFHESAHLDPVLSAYIRSVRSRFKVATLSNAGPDQRRAMIDKFELEQLVDLMVVSAEEGIEKPDPAIYLLTARRLGAGPAHCVFVDDRIDNVRGAAAVGMQAFVHSGLRATVSMLRALTSIGPQPRGLSS